MPQVGDLRTAFVLCLLSLCEFDTWPVFIQHVFNSAAAEERSLASTGNGRRNRSVCKSHGMLYNPVACLFNCFTTVVSQRKCCVSM